MNNSKFKLFALLLSGLLLYAGCRKIDNEIEKSLVPDKPAIVTEKFFAVPNSSNSKVKDIAQAIFKQNEKNLL